ncbi:hypothetical protein [Rhizobium oryzicola]|uniref:Tetratricopeptide repeat protein n=1 Tax=Rhizobium oryzicola TaxID=1232668 RepID=A0ABT8SYG5_9HYPH|nr:hypothetical protein [Rhizobium oryzicola]MDO1583509.1 hypothetical protein [Rhizobium oryzicola]
MGLIIITYLKANARTEFPRADIARLLWGDTDTARAQANLRKAASRIINRQNEIGRQFLSFSASKVSLGSDMLEADIDGLLAADLGIDHVKADRIALRLREDFLADVKSQSEGLAAWIERERDAHLSLLRPLVLASDLTAGSRAMRDAAIKILERNPDDHEVRNHLGGSSRRQQNRWQLPFSTPAQEASQFSEVPSLAHHHRLPRLVLLPPTSNGVNVEVASCAGALIDDVTIDLCSLREVSVIAPYTAAKIRDQIDKASVYENHGIRYILDTRLTIEGSGYSLFAQLIFFGSDEIIWADRFHLSDAGSTTSRRETAYRMAEAISRQINTSEFVRSDYEANGSVYRSFLRGQNHLMRLGLPDVRRARKHFREALQVDPEFAPAQSGMSRSYFLEWLITAQNDSQLLSLAENYAKAAIASDSRLPAAYKELGVAKLYMRQFDESAEFFATAESLSPDYANLIASFADALIQASRPMEGLTKVQQAIELNPKSPDEYFWTAAGACYSLERYEDALNYIGRMSDRAPADRLSAASWGMLGDTRKAGQFVRKTFEVHPTFDLDSWMALVPFKEEWQKQHYKEGLVKAGF